MPDVSVLIASIGRASLPKCIESIIASATCSQTSCEIIVADDSPSGTATARLAATGLRGSVRTVTVGSENISIARNACLDAAVSSFVAFVDDDEWVDASWLARLLSAATELSADAVFGSVVAHYHASTPAWLRAADPYTRVPGPRGMLVQSGGAGNALVRMASLQRSGLRFDPELGRTGGEDTDLFFRLYQSGGRLIAADDAVAHEDIPPSRTTVEYLRRRAINQGQTYARARLRERRFFSKCVFSCETIAKLGGSFAVGTALWALHRPVALRHKTRAWAHLGRLRTLARYPLARLY